MNRITSGTPELDVVLGGGFVENSINVIMGLPGTGKTILAEKVIFTNASEERPALYIGTVSEPLDKVLRYLQEFEYFDAGLIGDAVIYSDLSEHIRSDGLDGFLSEVLQLIKEHKPSLLVIDSFKALHAFADTPGSLRRHLSHLATALSSLSITAFLVGEYTVEEIGSLPEFAVADGVVSLTLQSAGVKDARFIRVVKQRGSSFINGEHAFKITAAGLQVFPRLITPDVTVDYDLANERQETGVPALDAMVSDGFWCGAATVTFGPPGSGKTLMGLHFIFKGIERGEKGLIATLEENPTQLQRIVAGFGWDLNAAIQSGMLELHYVSPVDVYIDEFMNEVIKRAVEGNVKRVMVDSLNDLEVAAPSINRFRELMYSFVQRLAGEGISLYATSEVGNLFSTSFDTHYGVSHMMDNVLLIHYVREKSEVKRAISIVKTRASRHDQRIRIFEITQDGIVLGPQFSAGTEFGSRT